MKILIVEHDESVLDILEDVICQDLCYHCVKTRTALGATAALKAQRPDIILLDVPKAGADTVEVIGLAKELYPEEPPRIIICSTMLGLPLFAARYGLKYLPKPFSLDELRHAVLDT